MALIFPELLTFPAPLDELKPWLLLPALLSDPPASPSFLAELVFPPLGGAPLSRIKPLVTRCTLRRMSPIGDEFGFRRVARCDRLIAA